MPIAFNTASSWRRYDLILSSFCGGPRWAGPAFLVVSALVLHVVVPLASQVALNISGLISYHIDRCPQFFPRYAELVCPIPQLPRLTHIDPCAILPATLA